MSESHAYTRTAKVADHVQTRQPRRSALAGPASQSAGLTPTQSMILQLQRTAGNAAVNALLRQYACGGEAGSARGAAPVNVQRWPTNTPNLDWSQTQSITTLQSGQPVLFFKDQTDPAVVVKAEDAPFGLTQMNAMMHQQVHGTPTIATRDASGSKSTILKLIADSSKSDASWAALGDAKDGKFDVIDKAKFPQSAPADRARAFMVTAFTGKSKIQVMAVAQGESGRKLAHKDAAGTDANPSRIRQLFDDGAYVTRLGQLTAADLFVENVDRVLANFGNWMTNANNAITLIDNMDSTSEGLWASADVVGSTIRLAELAPSNRDKLAKDLVAWLALEVRNGIKGRDAGIKAWLKEPQAGGTREQTIKQQLKLGLDQGCARIIKLYATGKTSKEGRAAKKGAKLAYKMDIKAGDQKAGTVPYWERLKARARYLKKLG